LSGYVYIMTNKSKGVLYVGVTNDISRRAWEHRTGIIKGFTWKYNLHRLVWFEFHEDIVEAIRREKQIKKWNRAWKAEMVERLNPSWNDLYETLNG
jgi:putative endonuclease